jgi:hypothetical protein
MRFLVWFMVLLVSAFAARANDSTAEMALGGLVLTQSDAISLDSEDLYISKDEVRVKYVFTNTSTKDVETLVAFPLPDQVFSEEGEGYYRDLRGDLGFVTKVDGKEVSYDIVEQALSQGVDISARLSALGLPLNQLSDQEGFTKRVAAVLDVERKKLVEEGLVYEQDNGNGQVVSYNAQWDFRMTVTRKQVFPAGRSVRVEHRYTPLAGGSVSGSLEPTYRKEDWAQSQIKRYCIDDAWFRAFDKKLVKGDDGVMRFPGSEVWLGYVLKSGANWKGGIKDFRLVVDKGKAQNLVSFCGEGVKKISDTQFEVRKKDFEPEKDLDVLIVEAAQEG